MIKKISIIGMLIATAFVLSFVESMIPISLAGFGIKLGLANIVVVFALYKYGIKEAFFLCVVKIIVSGLAFGGPTVLIYSLCGGLLSFIIMVIFKRWLNITGVSVLGAIFHNIGQILCAMFMLSTVYIITYLPVMLIAGVVTGLLVGTVSSVAINRISI